MKTWKAQNIDKATRIGTGISGIEVEGKEGWQYFDLLETEDAIIFGGYTNIGFLQSGYILKDGFSTNEVLQELVADLEVFYSDGAQYTNGIVFNDRM